MKKLKKTSELFWVLGIIFVAFGVAICSKANLGVSMIAAPAFIFYDFIAQFWSGISVGMAEYMFQFVMLIVLCIMIMKVSWKYLLGFLAAVIYGYCLNFFIWLIGSEPYEEIWLRWIMLIVGDCVVAFGVACFFKTYMPLQIYELFVAEFASVKNRNINAVKSIFDISLLMISVILAFLFFFGEENFDWTTIWYNSFHHLGFGTLVTTIINSPIITLFSKILDKVSEHEPMFPKLKKILKR